MQCYLVKFQSCLLGQLCNFEFLQDIIALFSKTVKPRNMKSFLHRVYKWVNIQKKFQVPRSHSIGEKCDLNCHLQVIIAFFSKTVRQRNMKFFCIEYPYGLMYKKNFLSWSHSIGEKCDAICKLSYSPILCDRDT